MNNPGGDTTNIPGPQKREGRCITPRPEKHRKVDVFKAQNLPIRGEFVQLPLSLAPSSGYGKATPLSSDIPQDTIPSSAMQPAVSDLLAQVKNSLELFPEKQETPDLDYEGNTNFDEVVSEIHASEKCEFFKKIEANVAFDSTGSTSGTNSHESEEEKDFGTSQERDCQPIDTTAVKHYDHMVETSQSTDKLRLCLTTVFLENTEALLQANYSTCVVVFRHCVSDSKKVLAACSICINPSTLILASRLLRTINSVSTGDNELYVHILEIAARKAKSRELLWPLWRFASLKRTYLDVLFLLIGHARIENTDVQWPNSYLFCCKGRICHMHSLARRICKALSDYIDVSFPPSLSPPLFIADPIHSILENVREVVSQIERKTRNQEATALRKASKELGLDYTGSAKQLSLLKQFLNSADRKQLGRMQAIYASLLLG